MKPRYAQHGKPLFGATKYVRLKVETETELRVIARRAGLPLATAIRWAVEEGLARLRRRAS